MLRAITLKVTVLDKKRTHPALVTEFRKALDGVKGFYEIDTLEASDPVDFTEVEENEDLSHNQIQFVKDAMAQGLEVDYGYSGRDMEGRCCPAVRVNSHDDFDSDTDHSTDSMGRRVVCYASS